MNQVDVISLPEVASFTGARIETCSSAALRRIFVVASFTGARIETPKPKKQNSKPWRRVLHGRADRNQKLSHALIRQTRRVLHGRADRNRKFSFFTSHCRCRVLHGRADRNTNSVALFFNGLVASFTGARIETNANKLFVRFITVASFTGARIET